MARTQHKFIAALMAAFLVVPMALTGFGAAQITDQSTTVGEFEEVVVDVDYSGSTTTDVVITDSTGTEVKNVSFSPSTSGGAVTKTYNLAQGDYNVSVSSTDETVVNSYSVTTQSSLSAVSSDTIDVGDNEEIVADVEFSANTSALVEVSDDTGTVVYSERVDGTVTGTSNVFETVRFEPSSAANYTVDVSAEDTSAINSTYVGTESTGLFSSGIVAGAGQTELIGFGLVLIGLVYAYREDWI